MAITLFAAPEQTANALAQIRSVLQAQQEPGRYRRIYEWIRPLGIDCLSFRRHNQTRLANRAQSLQEKYSSRAKMGRLMFSDLEITLLSSDWAEAYGRWKLKRANDQPHGRFTLILKRLPEGWRIVHDHTSAAPPPG
jgi:SnoaL-like domain